MSDLEDIQKLLRLKRYEKPPEGFFSDFVEEFHRRQRSELLNRSARGLFMERVATYFSGFGKARWMYAAGGTYAVAMVALLLIPRGSDTETGANGATQLTKVSALMDDSNFNLLEQSEESGLPLLDEIEFNRVTRPGRAPAPERLSRESQPQLFDRDVRITEF